MLQLERKLRDSQASTPSKLRQSRLRDPQDLAQGHKAGRKWAVAQPGDGGPGDWPAERDLHWKATLLRGRPSLEALWGKRGPWGQGRFIGYEARVIPTGPGGQGEGGRRQHEGRILPRGLLAGTRDPGSPPGHAQPARAQARGEGRSCPPRPCDHWRAPTPRYLLCGHAKSPHDTPTTKPEPKSGPSESHKHRKRKCEPQKDWGLAGLHFP